MKILHTATLALVLCALAAQPAFAKGKGNGKGQDDYPHEESYDDKSKHGHGHNSEAIVVPVPIPSPGTTIVFDTHHRERIQTYLHEHYQKKCPPGLAKKGKGCLPPGQARYVIGGDLPAHHEPIPAYLFERLGPPPIGTQYVMVDTDVLLVTEATKKILDAVTLLSAVK